MRSIESFTTLREHLEALPPRSATLLVAIDAPGGAGKSAFAHALRSVLPAATTVAMDDFFLPTEARLPLPPNEKPIGGDFDWPRVARQVLEPLSRNHPARYQRYDWDTDRLAEWHTIAPGGIVLIEGCYALHQALAPFYDFAIWLECPREIRLARGIARSGEQIRDRWEHDWMVAEDRYIAAQRPQDRANLIVDSSGEKDHDTTQTYIRLSR